MRIVGMIPVYNEVDVLESVIEHNLSQGIELVILDGSTDGSYNIAKQYLGKGVLAVRREVSDRFEWGLILERLYEMGLQYKPDWVLLSSADEFHESPYRGLTLKESVAKEDQRGFTLIQFNNFEFWPTDKDGDSTATDVRDRLKYYTWNDDCQFHSWKVADDITVRDGGGHYPIFPKNLKPRVSPNKYVLRHYRIRSYQQGLKKVFTERLPRYPDEERRKGWHLHYDNFRRDEASFIIDSRNLTKYDDDGKWVLKKTFDWTRGLHAKPWANPPIPPGLKVRVSSRVPFSANLWKIIFLRKYRIPKKSSE